MATEEKRRILEVPRNLHNISAGILNIFRPENSQIPYTGVKYAPPPRYFEKQPGQLPTLHLDRTVLHLMATTDGYMKGAIPTYIRGTNLNDPGHITATFTPKP